MEQPSSLNNNNYNNNINNNISNNNNYTHEKNTHSGNMYSYREDSINEPPKESNAIRRSIGIGLNPNLNPPFSQEVSRTNPQKYLEQFPESFHRLTNDKKNKNPFVQSSELRMPNQKPEVINQIPENDESNSGVQYKKRPVGPNNDLYYLATYIPIALLHVIMITLIGLFFQLDIDNDDNMKYNHIFNFFKDIHLFIFIGFGLLYSALRDHQWSSIFLVLFLGVTAIEFSFFHYYLWGNTFGSEKWQRFNIDFTLLASVEYNAASAIITLGALIGKLSLIQYYVITFFQTFFGSLNYFLNYEKIKAIDNGGSVSIHFFGAIFGLTVSCVLFCQDSEFIKINNNPHITSNYHSNMIAILGTIFLWLYFPSFNTAIIQNQYHKYYYTAEGLGYITENLRYRGIINTYLSMMGSLLSSFIVSPMFYRGKMKMEHLLHASYAGGIVIGGCCTICSSHWAAIVIGFFGGSVSILFLWKIKALLHSVRFEDSIGVLAIFALPGAIGGIMTCIFLGNMDNTHVWEDEAMERIFGSNKGKPAVQAGLQVSSIFISLAIAIVSGIVTGFLARIMICARNENYFVDSEIFIEEEGVVFPEYEYQDERDFNLNSSGNKLDIGGKEVNIMNNNNMNNNYNNNINNNNNINKSYKNNNNYNDNDNESENENNIENNNIA